MLQPVSLQTAVILFSGGCGDLATYLEGVLSYHSGELLTALMDFIKLARGPPAVRVCCDILKSSIRNCVSCLSAIMPSVSSE